MADPREVVIYEGGPGKRRPGDDLAPTFRIDVNDQPMSADINDFISTLEYESAIGMSDLFKLVIDNPGVIDDFFPDWTAHKAFQPGNEGSLYVGYGRADRPENFVGRAQWAKHLPIYPRSGVPQLELNGYGLDHVMMTGEGPLSRGTGVGAAVSLEQRRPVDASDNQGEVFAGIRHSEVVSLIADRYGMEKDIDHTTRPEEVVIKKGTKHYELLRGLANLNNRELWVDFDLSKRKWTLHWKEINRNQTAVFTFRYNDGDFSTLFEAEPEYGLRDTINEATILVFDGANQRWVSAIEIEDIAGPSPIYRQGGGLMERSTPAANPVKKLKSGKRPKAEARRQQQRSEAKDVIDEAMVNPAQFRIAAAGFAIDVLPPPGERFRDADEAARWLRRWFVERQDNFIAVNGSVIGVEQLRARQVHNLKGMSVRLDGAYYFTRVRHIVGETYTCEFTANKVIEQ